MKLEDGMYIRTKCNEFCNQVDIRKIVEIDEDDTEHNSFWIDEYIFDTYGEEQNYLRPNDVESASFNIIDLIEVGDYVNGHLVKATYLNGVTKYIKLGNAYENNDGVRTYNEDIKSIVTKELFENVEYRIGE